MPTKLDIAGNAITTLTCEESLKDIRNYKPAIVKCHEENEFKVIGTSPITEKSLHLHVIKNDEVFQSPFKAQPGQ